MHVTIEQIKQLIALSRGKKYAESKDVQFVTVQLKKVTAKVLGNYVYKVTLLLNGSLLQDSCSCLAFSDYGPCKHLAAVAFALQELQTTGYQESAYCTEQIDQYNKF